MTWLALWPAAALPAVTGAVGVLSGFVVHWWLELRALRPAYRQARRELSERHRSGYAPPLCLTNEYPGR